MEKLTKILYDLDSVTLAEIEHFIELKLTEHSKFRAQIARDMARLGEDAFRDPRAYDKLKAKYKVAHAGKKKLAILEMERQAWCK